MRDGLKAKYNVYKKENGEKVEECFVLRPQKDLAAAVALRAYASCTDNKGLGEDILNWLKSMNYKNTNIEGIKSLINMITDKLVLDLSENTIACPDCKGFRMILKQTDDRTFFISCPSCYSGKIYVCKHCGETNKTDFCQCDDARKERDKNHRETKSAKEKERFDKAEKINYEDFDGYVFYGDRVMDDEELREAVAEAIIECEELPEYLWAAEGQPHFSLDIRDIILDKCEDGYEDMHQRLGIESPLLSQAQELLDKWEKENEGSIAIYNESRSKAVMIDKLVDIIREEVGYSESEN